MRGPGRGRHCIAGRILPAPFRGTCTVCPASVEVGEGGGPSRVKEEVKGVMITYGICYFKSLLGSVKN